MMEVSTINKIYYLDMFAGIGGFRSGLSNVGDFFVPVGYCEIDPYARKAYEAIYDTKGELFFEDARKIDPEDLPHLDLICGGFPCQSFSVAGRRRGLDDERGTLFFEIARIAAVKKPKTTNRYLHPYAESMKEASEKMERIIRGKTDGEIAIHLSSGE